MKTILQPVNPTCISNDKYIVIFLRAWTILFFIFIFPTHNSVLGL